MFFDDLLDPELRDARAMLRLNNEHAHETSLLDLDSLNALLATAYIARGVDRGATALLIAFKHDAYYVNPNFTWFKARRESFVYVDRIIVAKRARGEGIATQLYKDLFDATFHAAMGFCVVGEASIHDGTKTVRYLERSVT